MMKRIGAWVTDIDDTLIESGVTPSDDWIEWLSEKIRILRDSGVLFVPMSGVAISKLGPRILYRLPEDVLSNILYYAGDGSQKYMYDIEKKEWVESKTYRRVFSDLQALALLGRAEFMNQKEGAEDLSIEDLNIMEEKLNTLGFDGKRGIIGYLSEELIKHGFDPDKADIYYRGGSISWLILGDISADSYKDPEIELLREKLIKTAAEMLQDNRNLVFLGEEEVTIPFPGARGIKFVLKGNSKERSMNDLIERHSIKTDNILFAGNEIFKDGNDNMIRNIKGITLLSVGDRTDPGEFVIEGGVGVDANNRWMNSICNILLSGYSWQSILEEIRIKGKLLILQN